MNAEAGFSSSPSPGTMAAGVLAVVLERMSTAVALVDAQHRVVWTNPAMVAIHPPAPEAAEPAGPAEADGVVASDLAAWLRPLVQQALHHGLPSGRTRFTAAMPGRSGQPRDWEVETIPVESPEGQPLAALLVMDVTHEREDQRLRQPHEHSQHQEPSREAHNDPQSKDLLELRAAEREKLQFLAVLGHELRNPIGAIHLGVEVLKEALAERLGSGAGASSGPDRSAVEYTGGDGNGAMVEEFDAVTESFGMLDRNLRLVRRLIDDLVDYNRGFRGKLSMQLAPVDLCELVEGSVQEFQQDLDEAGLSCHTEFAVSPPCIVQADPDRLRQVVGNLLRNSIRHTPPGGQVVLRLHSTSEVNATPPSKDAQPAAHADGRRIVLEVTDTGDGVDPLLLPRLFEPFVQGETGAGGLGLGLSVCLQIVRAHGGEITAHSNGRGTGASFRVSFPAPTISPDPATDRELRR